MRLRIVLATAFSVCFALLMAVSCSSESSRDDRIRAAVRQQLELYPLSTLQDLYKSFFQAEFGAEHIVADTASAGQYLDYELGIPDPTSILFEPVGADSSFFRVHLRCVQDSLISREQLFDAFIDGVNKVEIPQIEKWNDTWRGILTVIEGMNLDLQNFDVDRSNIEELLKSGQYALHHSETFSDVYDPHYRIVRKDIFFDRLFPYLSE